MTFKIFFENISSAVFYHGSFRIFNKFSSRFPESNDYGYYGYGYYFTPNEKTARMYGPNLYKCELNIKTPLYWNKSPELLWETYEVVDGYNSPKNSKELSKLLTKRIKEQGHDSIIVKNSNLDKILELCVFDDFNVKIISKQIASDMISDEEYH